MNSSIIGTIDKNNRRRNVCDSHIQYMLNQQLDSQEYETDVNIVQNNGK